MNMIDLHCDTILALEEGKMAENLYENTYHVDIKKLQQSNAAAQFFALFIDSGKAEQDGILPWDRFLNMYEIFQAQMKKYPKYISHAGSFADLQQNMKEGKISAFLTIEEGGVLDGKIDRVKETYDKGVRLITLTWNYPNSLGFPHRDNDPAYNEKGLTTFGFEVVEAMNHLGMIIDVSHLSDAGFYDVLKASQKPFVASHSNARAVRDHGRNLTDEMLKKLGEAGGVAGINFCPYFLCSEEICSPEILVSHIDHMVNKAGIEAVALGTDFDGIGGDLRIEHIGQMDKLMDALQRKGYSQDNIEKIWFSNAARIIAEVIK